MTYTTSLSGINFHFFGILLFIYVTSNRDAWLLALLGEAARRWQPLQKVELERPLWPCPTKDVYLIFGPPQKE